MIKLIFYLFTLSFNIFSQEMFSSLREGLKKKNTGALSSNNLLKIFNDFISKDFSISISDVLLVCIIVFILMVGVNKLHFNKIFIFILAIIEVFAFIYIGYISLLLILPLIYLGEIISIAEYKKEKLTKNDHFTIFILLALFFILLAIILIYENAHGLLKN